MALHLSYVPRPDRVTKTGVIAPYPVRQYDPVYLARQTIWPFLQGIRGVSAVWAPQPHEIVAAANKVVDKAMSGGLGGLGSRTVGVKVGGRKYRIRLGKPARSTVEARVQQAAYAIAQGRPFNMQSSGGVTTFMPSASRAAWARRIRGGR